jgi:hypothetical protein
MLCSQSTPPPWKNSEQRPALFWPGTLWPRRLPSTAHMNTANGTRESPANLDKIQESSLISASMGLPSAAPMIALRLLRVDPWSEAFVAPARPKHLELARVMPAKGCMPVRSISTDSAWPQRRERNRHLPVRSGGERSFEKATIEEGMAPCAMEQPSRRPSTNNMSLERTRLARAKLRLVLSAESP